MKAELVPGKSAGSDPKARDLLKIRLSQPLWTRAFAGFSRPIRRRKALGSGRIEVVWKGFRRKKEAV